MPVENAMANRWLRGARAESCWEPDFIAMAQGSPGAVFVAILAISTLPGSVLLWQRPWFDDRIKRREG
ncbi:MAG: hypothetical protein EBT68_00795 [Verrucomicrobia bacterium]|nr:hypothetical protein [Verrucomicrobiota bacterium]